MVTCAIVLYFNDSMFPNSILLIAFIIGLIVSYCGTLLTILDRKINGSILKWAVDAAEKASFHRITLLEVLSAFIYFVIMTLLAYAAMLIGNLTINTLQPFLTATIEGKLIVLKPGILGIGIALTLPMFYRAFKQLRTM
jgi:mannose/fructose/N-acetylgalactosamine-specific phosphotransferase system component IIC